MPTNLSPKAQTSAIVLPASGAATPDAGEALKAACPFGIYTGSLEFITGASLQVAYVYKKLGGDVVDIELTSDNVYAAYEEAVLEYSYIINLHQSKNVLSSMLGQTTGTFNHNGEIVGATGVAQGTNVQLRYPRFELAGTKRMGDGLASIAGFGGTMPQYSASFKPVIDQQDYDLQTIVEDAGTSGTDDAGNPIDFEGKINDRRVVITKVYYRSPRAMWRFYGYYGGIGVVGNYSTYGQFADDATFEIVPTWQNKLQAVMYEDSIMTRTSNYAYEIINNKLRLYPTPSNWDLGELERVWFRFYVESNVWDGPDYHDGTTGINNMNTLPFENLPYDSINSMGKQWIRKYCLALCKEMLGQIRGKFTTMPIPGESVTLNHAELLGQAKEEQEALKTKLIESLKEMEYTALTKDDSERSEATATTFKNSPLPIFVG
tara:strand:+ start:1044 stop:2342 length:1299 start_codon:yes stop_codon:yes gene_type:complete